MQLSYVTPVVLTYNEEANIWRAMASLRWARRVSVVDSGSTDKTLEILAGFPNVRVVERAFDDFASQWNSGLAAVETPWVLTLDADYRVTEDLLNEIMSTEADDIDCYDITFEYHVFGKALRSCIYPPRPALFRADAYEYRMDGHTQRLYPESRHPRFQCPLVVDDRKSLSRWLANQATYADAEVEKLTTLPPSALSIADKLRARIVLAPPAVLIYCLLFKGLVLDGWRGLFYTGERVVAELILSLALLRKVLQGIPGPGSRYIDLIDTPIDRRRGPAK